jgi:dihydroxyacetone kinase DhaKLM complex PTS-EIIA-like component DhaM
MTSVHNYKGLADFRQFIRNITEKTRTLSSVLAGFREISLLPKRLGQLTVEQVTTQTELIEEIYKALKKMKPETKYKLPYDEEERQKEILENIAENHEIDMKKAYCKILTGFYKDDKTGQQFPWAVEIAMAQRKDLGVGNAGQVFFIGSVNDTPAVDGGEKYFQSDQHAYKWTERKKFHEARSVRDVLDASGFDSTSRYTSSKRHASVVYVNVKTDVPDWLGAAGKTHMNQVPYAETIAKTLFSMSRNIDSYRGQGFALSRTPISSTNYKTATEYVDEFLIRRRRDVEANPNIRSVDRLTQRGVAYRLRPGMIDDGFEPRKNWGITMDTMTNMISARCKAIWPNESIDREYLGIYAKARGMFYYRGRTTPIDFDSIGALASEAALNVVIEKEGVPAVLEPYADKYRVALISTQGRFAEYVKDFVASVIEEETIVVTLLDDDKVGHEMAESTDAINIGVNDDTVLWLHDHGYSYLTVENVREIDPSTGRYRIEIDSILAEVGAEGLWKYIMHKLEELAPLDIRKSIDMPANDLLYHEKISEFQSFLNEYTSNVTKDERDKIDEKLGSVNELPDAKEMEKEIIETLTNIVAENEGMRLIVSKLTEVRNELRELDGGEE